MHFNSIEKLFGTNINKLSKSDKKLILDLQKISNNKSGGGYSFSLEQGDLNGMSLVSGYDDKNPPLYIGELLQIVAKNCS